LRIAAVPGAARGLAERGARAMGRVEIGVVPTVKEGE
jgi:hypothetical protein